MVPSIFIYFPRFASKNIRAARDDFPKIDPYSLAADIRALRPIFEHDRLAIFLRDRRQGRHQNL